MRKIFVLLTFALVSAAVFAETVYVSKGTYNDDLDLEPTLVAYDISIDDLHYYARTQCLTRWENTESSSGMIKAGDAFVDLIIYVNKAKKECAPIKPLIDKFRQDNLDDVHTGIFISSMEGDKIFTSKRFFTLSNFTLRKVENGYVIDDGLGVIYCFARNVDYVPSFGLHVNHAVASKTIRKSVDGSCYYFMWELTILEADE